MWEAAGNHYPWSELEQAAAQALAFRSFIDPSASAFQSPADMCAAVQSFCAQSGQPVPQTVGEIARCIFESLSLSYREALEAFERVTGRTLQTIRLVGGGCLNTVLCQMMADATGRTVVAGPVEAAALGNGLMQAVATGHLKSFAEGQAALRQSVEFRIYTSTGGNAWRNAFERYKLAVAPVR